jgi:hypothetical protein
VKRYARLDKTGWLIRCAVCGERLGSVCVGSPFALVVRGPRSDMLVTIADLRPGMDRELAAERAADFAKGLGLDPDEDVEGVLDMSRVQGHAVAGFPMGCWAPDGRGVWRETPRGKRSRESQGCWANRSAARHDWLRALGERVDATRRGVPI